MSLLSPDAETFVPKRQSGPHAASALLRRVDLTTLRLFLAICEEKNLTRAAARRHAPTWSKSRVSANCNTEVGLCHPPVGLNPDIASRIAQMGISEITVAVLPWLMAMLIFPRRRDLRSGNLAVVAAYARPALIYFRLCNCGGLDPGKKSFLAGI